jgi:hypothetical protein
MDVRGDETTTRILAMSCVEKDDRIRASVSTIPQLLLWCCVQHCNYPPGVAPSIRHEALHKNIQKYRKKQTKKQQQKQNCARSGKQRPLCMRAFGLLPLRLACAKGRRAHTRDNILADLSRGVWNSSQNRALGKQISVENRAKRPQTFGSCSREDKYTHKIAWGSRTEVVTDQGSAT